MTTIVYRDGILAVDDLVTLKNSKMQKGVKCGHCGGDHNLIYHTPEKLFLFKGTASYKGDTIIAGAAYGSGNIGWTIKTVLGQNHSDPDAVFSSFAHLLDFEHIGGVILMCEKGIYDLNLRRRGFVSVKLDEPYVVRGHGGPAASSAIQLFNADAVTAVQFSGVGNNATGTTVYSVSREEKIIVKTVMLSAEALKNTLFAQSLHVVEDKATEAPPALPVKQKAKRKAAAK